MNIIIIPEDVIWKYNVSKIRYISKWLKCELEKSKSVRMIYIIFDERNLLIWLRDKNYTWNSLITDNSIIFTVKITNAKVNMDNQALPTVGLPHFANIV